MQTSLEALSSFWKGKRVLITGNTGFKGTWLTAWLRRLGAEVSGFALPPDTNPSLFSLLYEQEPVFWVDGDVREFPVLELAVRAAAPEIVFHLAAQPIVHRSYEEPVETFATNVLGTVNVLETARRVDGVRVVVVVTSDKCYENREWVWAYRESDRLGGRDPYSNSKACAELAVDSYRASFFAPEGRVQVATARSGNVIGGGDWSASRLLPDLMRSLSEGRGPEIRNPHATRPWQHVLEPLRGYMMLARRLWEDGERFAEAWNFGPEEDDTRPVGWISDHVMRLWGPDADWVFDDRQYPHESNLLRLDSAKAKLHLGWYPVLRLPEALGWTVDWYRGYHEGENAARLTHAQIAQFESMIFSPQSDQRRETVGEHADSY